MDALVYLVEGLFLILFIGTLRAYIRRRDPISRDLALIFSPLAFMFAGQVWERVSGSPLPVLGLIGGVLLLLQPVFTLHLVSLVQPIPRWLLPVSAIAVIALLVPALLLPEPPAAGGLRTVAGFAAIGAFIVIMALAAIYLLQEAIRREGPVGARMGLASISTGVFAAALFVVIVASVLSAPPELSRGTAAALALLSGIGYVLAFLTPGPIRRIWQARTTVDYTRELLTRSSEPVSAIWAGFTDMAVRMQGGAAAMLTGPSDGSIAVAAASGLAPPDNLHTMAWSEFDARLDAADVKWDVPAADVGPLHRRLAEAARARFVSVVPIEVPGGRRAALVLLSSHRALFHPSDAKLLAALGAQTAIVAERRAVMAEQQELADRLVSTVDALHSASAAKSDFVASMSHEFRTPLSAIIGFSDLMSTEPRDGGKVTVPFEWVEHVQRGGQHLLELVNDVLDLSRVEAGRLDLHPEAVDVGHAVNEAVNGLRPLADRKRLTLDTKVDAGTIEVDRGRFRQILYNLVSNAIKYTPDGGSIRVAASGTDGEIRMAVTDTGIGIAPEEHERVFEEFRQVGDPEERQPGTGLGLAVTRRLAEAHGGRIELDSARGRGSTFTLVLPVSGPGLVPAAAGTAAPQPADVARSAAAGDILVIEDDPSAVRLLREYLEGAGYAVRVAATGETGIAAAAAKRPAAIVLDVLLPGIDGWEVLRRLKAESDLRDVPVVIVTVVEEREVGLALGAVDYLLKPIHRDALLGCLARYVSTVDTAATKRVLVVDDEAASIAMIRGALESAGVEVVAALGGRAALAWAASGDRVDMVVCDLLMPDVDGFEVIAALKDNDRTADLPIVVGTAHDLTSDQKARLNGHILGIVAKGQDARVGLLDWLRYAAPSAAR